ncbi:uncharacterized protein LOC126835568 [Adelges cooleyi]|uniref:uncharacterized protein LOC126835568 n=1 Tax=Adelges cooleyi TaxID=133065 RepID=UPI00217FE86F|nr:uncharacterized protein LOC126835568 [Adelges cooleyi]
MKMKFTYNIFVLLTLSCIVQSKYETKKKETKTVQRKMSKLSSKHHYPNGPKDSQSVTEMEDVLATMAKIIQSSIDQITMNNKEFKIRLKKMYNKSIGKTLKPLIRKNLREVNKIMKLIKEDQRILAEIKKRKAMTNALENEKTARIKKRTFKRNNTI